MRRWFFIVALSFTAFATTDRTSFTVFRRLSAQPILAPRLRGEQRRRPLHSPARTGLLARDKLREGWRRRRSAPGEVWRHLLPDLHRIQQARCPALPGHVERSAPLGAKGHSSSGLQGQLECRLDQVGRDRAGESQRQILDVLARYHTAPKTTTR